MSRSNTTAGPRPSNTRSSRPIPRTWYDLLEPEGKQARRRRRSAQHAARKAAIGKLREQDEVGFDLI